MHNTLAASDYGLLDETYAAAAAEILGRAVVAAADGNHGARCRCAGSTGLHVYAHCQSGAPGGVSLLVINTDRAASHALVLPVASVRYTLGAANLEDTDVRLNGHALQLDAGDELPPIAGAPVAAGTLTFAPATITFLAVAAAADSACR